MDVPNKMVVHIPGTPGSGVEEPSDSDDTSDWPNDNAPINILLLKRKYRHLHHKDLLIVETLFFHPVNAYYVN